MHEKCEKRKEKIQYIAKKKRKENHGKRKEKTKKRKIISWRERKGG